jgi:hypothetical protein
VKTRVAAWLVLMPAMAATLVIVALEAGRARTPRDPLFAAPQPASLAQAILDGDTEGGFALLQAGQDVNQPIETSVPGAPSDRVLTVTPLVLAAAAHDTNNVRMLLSAGADLSRPENRLAVCLAHERGYHDVVAILAPAVPAGAACPGRALD